MGSLILYSIPLALYALILNRKNKVDRREIALRLGLTLGDKRYYLWALGFTFVGIALAWSVLRLVPAGVMEEQNIATSRFAGQGLTVASFLSAILFGLFETGLGEELFFRGLIAGWLGRRMGIWRANVVQSAIFTLPHLLLLTVDLRLWPFAVVLPFISGLLVGWLRLKSGSVVPGWLVHGLSNVVSAMLAMV